MIFQKTFEPMTHVVSQNGVHTLYWLAAEDESTTLIRWLRTDGQEGAIPIHSPHTQVQRDDWGELTEPGFAALCCNTG